MVCGHSYPRRRDATGFLTHFRGVNKEGRTGETLLFWPTPQLDLRPPYPPPIPLPPPRTLQALPFPTPHPPPPTGVRGLSGRDPLLCGGVLVGPGRGVGGAAAGAPGRLQPRRSHLWRARPGFARQAHPLALRPPRLVIEITCQCSQRDRPSIAPALARARKGRAVFTARLFRKIDPLYRQP